MEMRTLIEVYDRHTNKLITEVLVTDTDMFFLKNLAPPKREDPYYSQPYPLEENQFERLKNKIDGLEKYEYKDYAFLVQAKSLSQG